MINRGTASDITACDSFRLPPYSSQSLCIWVIAQYQYISIDSLSAPTQNNNVLQPTNIFQAFAHHSINLDVLMQFLESVNIHLPQL